MSIARKAEWVVQQQPHSGGPWRGIQSFEWKQHAIDRAKLCRTDAIHNTPFRVIWRLIQEQVVSV